MERVFLRTERFLGLCTLRNNRHSCFVYSGLGCFSFASLNSSSVAPWLKSQKINKPVRQLLPSSSSMPSRSQVANGNSQSSKDDRLGDLKVAINGVTKQSVEEWKSKIN